MLESCFDLPASQMSFSASLMPSTVPLCLTIDIISVIEFNVKN